MGFGFGPGSMHAPHVHMHDFRDVRGKVFDPHITRRLLSYLSPYKREMLAALGLMLISSGLALLTPFLVKKTIDDYIAQGDAAGLAWMGLATLAAYIAEFAIAWRRRINLSRVGNNVLRTMRDQLFAHYQNISLSYFDE
ncbi:MAG: ABC transporter transmembrane domain-containing protein, partial [Chloroflexota bacterium]